MHKFKNKEEYEDWKSKPREKNIQNKLQRNLCFAMLIIYSIATTLIIFQYRHHISPYSSGRRFNTRNGIIN